MTLLRSSTKSKQENATALADVHKEMETIRTTYQTMVEANHILRDRCMHLQASRDRLRDAYMKTVEGAPYPERTANLIEGDLWGDRWDRNGTKLD